MSKRIFTGEVIVRHSTIVTEGASQDLRLYSGTYDDETGMLSLNIADDTGDTLSTPVTVDLSSIVTSTTAIVTSTTAATEAAASALAALSSMGGQLFASFAEAEAATIEDNVELVWIIHNGMPLAFTPNPDYSCFTDASGTTFGPALSLPVYYEHWQATTRYIDPDETSFSEPIVTVGSIMGGFTIVGFITIG